MALACINNPFPQPITILGVIKWWVSNSVIPSILKAGILTLKKNGKKGCGFTEIIGHIL